MDQLGMDELEDLQFGDRITVTYSLKDDPSQGITTVVWILNGTFGNAHSIGYEACFETPLYTLSQNDSNIRNAKIGHADICGNNNIVLFY